MPPVDLANNDSSRIRAHSSLREKSLMLIPGKSPPVLVLAFNRPDTARRVFEVLRVARPDALYFAVDGARTGKHEESERVAQVQSLVEMIDWKCEVKTLFRKTNLGCKIAVSEAISWFFDQEEAGVILEDDCLAHPSFITFAGELLERYRDDERVMLISGNNFQFGRRRTSDSYYFSRYNHIWGWASWRRSWKLYDHGMKAWPAVRDGKWLEDILGDSRAAAYWARIFDTTFHERNTSWAYRWTFSCWINDGLSILPNINLVSNIGFGSEATHTFDGESPIANLPLAEMSFPLQHPEFMIRDAVADMRTERALFSGSPSIREKAGKVRRFLGL